MYKEKILITGGLGFVGQNLVKCLSKENKILVIDVKKVDKDYISKNIEYKKIDIRDSKLKNIIKDFNPDIVIHCAAQTSVIESINDPKTTKSINVNGTKNIIDSLKELESCFFVFISSGGAIYGNPKYLPVDENHPLNPISEYGFSKFEGENIIERNLLESNIKYAILRPSNIYGPGQKTNNVIPIFFERMTLNKQVIIYGDGSSSRDYIFIYDLVEIIKTICEKKISTNANVSTNKEIKIIEIFTVLKEKLFYQLDPKFEPIRDGEVEKIYLDNKKIKNLTGFNNFTSLEKGIEEIINSQNL